MVGVESLALLLCHAIAHGKLLAGPEVAVVGEVGILDDGEEAGVAGVFLSANGAEAILELVVGDDYFAGVGVSHARGVDCAVAEHLAFREDLPVSSREGNGLVVDRAAVIQVLVPGDACLVAV